MTPNQAQILHEIGADKLEEMRQSLRKHGVVSFAKENNEITIPRERYEELLRAESDASRFRNLFKNKFEHFDSISYNELKLISELYNIEIKDPLSKKESEGVENG